MIRLHDLYRRLRSIAWAIVRFAIPSPGFSVAGPICHSFDIFTSLGYEIAVAGMKRLPFHKAMEPLAWLGGTWKTETHGYGKYPTLEDFTYCDEIQFGSIGQTMYNYLAQSWNPEDGRPMHRETGFLKIIPDTNIVSLILAQNSGLITIEQGKVVDKVVSLNSIAIQRSEGMTIPVVTQTRRQFKLNGKHLEYTLCMATIHIPDLAEHLWAKYVKVCDDA